jgi:Phosphatidylinositol-4-phosphate 5-Kinase
MHEMVESYSQHMAENPSSTLVRITDFLYAPQLHVGSLFRITPSHHVIMENVLYGQDQDSLSAKWETYDLKPTNFFYPERDIAGGSLASEAIMERLLDTFHDKIRVHEDQKKQLIEQLTDDCRLLEQCNVVDYSLFLVRFPYTTAHDDGRYVPELSERASPWRNGTPSSDNKWIYRVVVLDFFWAKHKIHAMMMTGLVTSFNIFSGKGHMSITTSPSDYREKFLNMVDSLFDTSA